MPSLNSVKRPALAAALLVAVAACSLHEAGDEAGRDARTEAGTVAQPAPVRAAQALKSEDDAKLARDQSAAESPPVPPASVAADGIASARERRAGLLGGYLGKQRATACCIGILPPVYQPEVDRENYEHFNENPVKLAREFPVSTFSIDVDTGSYSNVRRMLNSGSLPPADAVRVEELINYFPYDYPVPRGRDTPFSVTTALAEAPWSRDKVLMQIGIKGFEVPREHRKPANLVFLVDVSGSMQSEDKLPLLKRSLQLLARQMRSEDCVSLVVYAGAAGTVLGPTPGNRQAEILEAIGRLEAGGSTNGADGIRLAYDLARQAYKKDGINRVLLATDGDFNVGTVNFEALLDIAEREREGGVSLTTLGFGTGNYNDKLMERLADAGNGNYAYIDKLSEGRKVLVEQMSGTLQTIAKDVKIQVEFNPAAVAEYRLIGYENRALRREDFNNDRIDAGEIGAGHTVTALYELTLAGSAARLVDPLRYALATAADRGAQTEAPSGDEMAYVRVRYKAPKGDKSRLLELPVYRKEIRPANGAGADLRFAAAVAAFGQLLRGGQYLEHFGYRDVARLAAAARGEDPQGYRSEFLSLVRLAESLATPSDG